MLLRTALSGVLANIMFIASLSESAFTTFMSTPLSLIMYAWYLMSV